MSLSDLNCGFHRSFFFFVLAYTTMKKTCIPNLIEPDSIPN